MTPLQQASWKNIVVSVRCWETSETTWPEIRVFKGFPGTDNLRLGNYKGSPFCNLRPSVEFQETYLRPCELALQRAFLARYPDSVEGIHCAFKVDNKQTFLFQLHELA